MGRRTIWAAVLAACCVGARAEESGGADPEKTLSPFFFIKGGDPAVDRLPLESTRVSAAVTGVIADVTVRQRYKNEGARPINAVYVFPASTRAAVHGLTLTVGDRVVRAKIKEREEAKKEYQAAQAAGKSASLLEQERPNVFRMSVANLMPGDRIDVELHYSELLVPEGGVYEFVYPTVVGPRYTGQAAAAAPPSEGWVGNPTFPEGQPPAESFALSVSVSGGMPLESLSSPSHKLAVEWKGRTEAAVTLDPSESSGANRDFILRYSLSGGQIRSGLLMTEGADENFFLLMVQPPQRVTSDLIPPREYVFVLDVSGSMNGFPLDTAKTLLRELIGSLRPDETFNVVFFSGGSNILAPASVGATPENIASAIRMIDSQRGGGGTELLAAVQRAVGLPHPEGRSRHVVVVTDGFIGAEKDVHDFIRSNLGRANVYAFGIGSSVNRHLIEGIAKAGLGEPFIVLNPQEAPRQAARFKTYVQSPVLTGLSVQYAGFEAYDVEPASLPDVLAERPIIVHGKWRGARGGTITVSGVSGRGRWVRRFAPADNAPSARHGALRTLWARQRVADISDFGFGSETSEQRAELVRLGLKYSLLTKHTSFIAVHEVVRNLAGGAEDVRQPLPLPQGVSDLAVGEFRQAPEPGLPLLLCVSVLALAAARRRRVRAPS